MTGKRKHLENNLSYCHYVPHKSHIDLLGRLIERDMRCSRRAGDGKRQGEKLGRGGERNSRIMLEIFKALPFRPSDKRNANMKTLKRRREWLEK